MSSNTFLFCSLNYQMLSIFNNIIPIRFLLIIKNVSYWTYHKKTLSFRLYVVSSFYNPIICLSNTKLKSLLCLKHSFKKLDSRSYGQFLSLLIKLIFHIKAHSMTTFCVRITFHNTVI